MRKLLMFSLCLLMGLGVFAQDFVSTETQNRNVIIEEFTGRNCSYCPDGHVIANQIVKDNPGRVLHVNVHAGGFSPTSYPNLNTTESNTILNGFGVSGFPSGAVNRSDYTALNRGQWESYASQQMNQVAECNVAGKAIIDPATRVAKITVEVYYTGNSAEANNYLTVMMLQDSIWGSQLGGAYNPEQYVNDQYCHLNVLRSTVTPTWGKQIAPTTAGTLITKEYEYEIPETIGTPNGVEVDLDNIKFLAFVTEGVKTPGNSTRPILNACELTTLQGTEEAIYPYIANVNLPSGITCSETRTFNIGVTNGGLDEITSLKIEAYVDGELTAEQAWEGRIASYEATSIEMDINVTGGTHNVEIKIVEANNIAFEFSKSVSATFDEWVLVSMTSNEEEFTIEIMQDKYGNQITWELIGSDGTTIMTGGPYTMLVGGSSATQLHQEKVTIPNGECVKFVIRDAVGNGICCQYGEGYYRIKNAAGDIIVDGDGDFGSEASILLSMGGEPVTENFWTPDPTLYANNMTVIANVNIDGIDQANPNLELGAFCGDEVRGSVLPQFVPAPINRYEYFLMVYGNSNDNITFKLYDHESQSVLELDCLNNISFEVNGTVGNMMEPQPLNFKSTYWTPDPSLYANNMTVIANVQIDGIDQANPNLELGAFCGDEVRGSIKPQFVPAPINRYEYFLMVYGNANDNITFKLYDHESQSVVDLDCQNNISFEVNGTVGNMMDPYNISFTSDITQSTALTSGWNWYSSYIDVEGAEGLELMKEALGTSAAQIKNQTAFIDYASIWFGTLTATNLEEMYMIKMNSALNMETTGPQANPTDHPITLGTNWKWIGYPVNGTMSVNEAFSNITPNSGDYVKSQVGFAQYYEGLGWTGTLNTMTPGQGYMYQNTSGTVKTLVYPEANAKSELDANITSENNHWVPNSTKYPTNMTMIATVEGMKDYEVAAFCNGEVRGSARPIYVEELDSYMIFLTIYGEENDEISFRYFDLNTEEEVELIDVMNYGVNVTIGDVMNPHVLNFATLNVDEMSSNLSIYPNPVEKGGKVYFGTTCEKVEIYNTLGAKVAEYTDVNSIEGIEASGVYVVKAINNGNVSYSRVIVE